MKEDSYSMLAETQPPHFSNRSVELQHAVSDVTEQSVPVADSLYVLFSAHKGKEVTSYIKKRTRMPYGTVFGFGGIESRVPRTIESGTAARKGTESDPA
ncbi:hypothetical protein LguiB_036291 [Lonicera macranthoides]